MMGSLRLEMERGSDGAFGSGATSVGSEGSHRLDTERWDRRFGLGPGAISAGIEGSFRFETGRSDSIMGFGSIAMSTGTFRFVTERERSVWAFFGSSATANIVGIVGCVRDFGIRMEAGRRGMMRTGLASSTGTSAEVAV